MQREGGEEMRPVEEIYLNSKEKRLLRRIEKYGLWLKDKRSLSKEFSTLNSYGMLSFRTDKRFPIEIEEGSTFPLENVCETVPDVAQYWRYTKNLQKKQWKESRRYWITTGIAIAALIKAFLPEIFAGWALLLKLLTQK